MVYERKQKPIEFLPTSIDHFLCCLKNLCNYEYSITYERLGDVSQAERKLSEARDWYLKCLDIRKLLTEETNTLQSQWDLSFCYERLGYLSEKEEKPEEAKNLFIKCLLLRKEIIQKTGNVLYLDNFAVINFKCGMLPVLSPDEKKQYLEQFCQHLIFCFIKHHCRNIKHSKL